MTRIENPRVGGSIPTRAPFKSSKNSDLRGFCIAAQIAENAEMT
jgi:hypothetical protein